MFRIRPLVMKLEQLYIIEQWIGDMPEYVRFSFGYGYFYDTVNTLLVAALAETISLSVLALPQAVATLRLVPGLLLIFFLGITATYAGYVIGQFKQAFPQVQNFADAGELIADPIGRVVMAVSQILILVFITAAHVKYSHYRQMRHHLHRPRQA